MFQNLMTFFGLYYITVCSTGGHTMGGIMAMHMAFRVFPDMAGVFGLSTFLPRETLVYKVSWKNRW